MDFQDAGLQNLAYGVHRVSRRDSSGRCEDKRLPQLLQQLSGSDGRTES